DSFSVMVDSFQRSRIQEGVTMAVCRALALAYHWDEPDRHSGSACLYKGQETAFQMAKRYALLRLKSPKPEGGFWEAFRLGLVDFGSSGEEYFDESGYPFPDEVHAFVHDWLNLSGDFQAAMQKVEHMKRDHNAATGTPDGERKKAQPAASTSEK